MRISRIYYPETLKPDQLITLTDQAFQHIAKVLRLKAGSPLILFNGQGGEFSAHIKTLDKRKADIQIESYHDKDIESPLKLHLAQALLRGDKMDYALQKATELGVSEITPIITERSTLKIDTTRINNKMQHWQQVIISSCEQCGRTRLPKLNKPIAILDFIKTANHAIVLDVDAKQTIKQLKPTQTLTLIIGPEGGFTEQELNQCEQKNIEAIRFGPRILRTETAGPAVIAVLQHSFGDLAA